MILPFRRHEPDEHPRAAEQTTSLDALVPAHLSTATFANGWFWTPDARFGLVEGVWRTRVGYAGGTKPSPTYYSMGDHTESFQVDFDPSVISYEELLDMFWESHDPSRPAYKTQYASLILAHDDEQLAAARESAARYEARTGRRIATRIDRLGTFWLAEDYHQKYYLRQDRKAMAQFKARFGDDEDALRESTDAARANAEAGGMGSCRL